jgi:uncharacterized protein YecE (DUF72 family)
MAVKVGLCGYSMGADTYFERYPVVEIQHTFYDPPPLLTLERWRAHAPPGFEFTLKAWQLITHLGTSSTYRKVKNPLTARQKEECGAFQGTPTVFAAWERTLASARALRATAVLCHGPASFKPLPENVANLRAFFAHIGQPDGLRLLWEPRGPAWTDETVRGLCTELSLTHVVDPFVRPSVTSGLRYFRLHGIGSAYRAYTDDELVTLAGWVAGEQEAYVMFNNIPRPADSRRFMGLLEGRPMGPRPTPWRPAPRRRLRP